VADKSRHRSKKTAAGEGRHSKKASSGASRRAKTPTAERRVSQVSRQAGRGAPVAKVSRPKPAGDGAPSGMSANKKTTQRQGFKTNEYIVYPAHGVGQILAIEEQEIAGAKLELFVINFVKDKMTLRVPTAKIASVGMRKLAEPALVKKALETLKGRARIKRTMWSRRAQEYEAKINSGDIVAIAEVVRDLYRSEQQPEQSYSERQLYEAALDRLSREISAVQHITETEAVKEIEGALAKGPRRGAAKPVEVEAEAEDGVEDEAA
jgi:CarD family transcriptional regulator